MLYESLIGAKLQTKCCFRTLLPLVLDTKYQQNVKDLAPCEVLRKSMTTRMICNPLHTESFQKGVGEP